MGEWFLGPGLTMSIAILGDLHGCLTELKELLTILEARGCSKYILIGDLLDRGPDSAGVVKHLRELSYTHKVVLVKGNHELKHERYLKHIREKTVYERKMKDIKGLHQITRELSEDDVTWLDKAVLYYQLNFEEHDILLTHAGVPPCIKQLPDLSTFENLSSKDKKFYTQMLRVRYVNKKGTMITLGQEGADDSYWAEVYDGRFGHIYFGHEVHLQDAPKEYDHATGIDLGCVFGNKLCAALIQPDGSDVEFITVDAKETYSNYTW